jgi:hypothetical protein
MNSQGSASGAARHVSLDRAEFIAGDGMLHIQSTLHAAADIVKDISPNAWQHVHLIGAFDFEQTESQIDIDALAARYDDPDFWNRALIEAPDDSLA